jgi:hypothetical protein
MRRRKKREKKRKKERKKKKKKKEEEEGSDKKTLCAGEVDVVASRKTLLFLSSSIFSISLTLSDSPKSPEYRKESEMAECSL